MPRLSFADRWVLVTGASSGLGLEMARCLALEEQANVILAARRGDRLARLKAELEEKSDRRVEVVEVDLCQPDGADRLFREATALATVHAVINNAGMTYYGKATAGDLATHDRIMDLNHRAAMRLSLLFLEYLQGHGEGGIQNVTSMAAFMPVPYQSVYAASKHAIQCFTDGLRAENSRGDVVICTFAPGGIATDMLSDSGLDKKFSKDSRVNMSPRRAARIAIRGFKSGKAVTVPGLMNRATLFMARLLPRRWILWLAERTYRPPA